MFRDEFEYGDLILLSDPVGAVCGLILGCHVPPRIVVDHHIRSRKVQPRSAGLQGDQEHHHIVLLERGGHLHAVPLRRGAGEQIEWDLLLFQALRDDLKHRCKLGEQKDLMPR